MNMKRTAYCFDLDGTITSQEILPLISRELGIQDEISLLTDVTMKGLIPFESSFKLRVRLLSSIPISTVQKVVEKVTLQKRLISFIHEHKEDCYVVTGNLDVWIERLKEKLGCAIFSSVAQSRGDRLLGVGKILNKADVIDGLRDRYDRIVAVGDGMNDAPMFERADVKIAYGGVHAPVETLIDLATFVTYAEGGLCNILNTL